MLRLLIDWASDKFASALSWINEMASSYGFGFRKRTFAENCEISPDSSKKTRFSADQTEPTEKRRFSGQIKNDLKRPEMEKVRETPRCVAHADPDMDIFTNFSFPLLPEDQIGLSRRSCYFAPGRASVKLVPFVRIPSNFTQFDVFSEANSYAKVVKTPPCCARRKMAAEQDLTPLLFSMEFWKIHYGIFSALVRVDDCDCAAYLKSENLCPVTIFILKKISQKMVELFGKAVAMEETVVFQDGKRTKMIYVAPTIEADNTRENSLKGDGTEKEESKEKSQQEFLKNCESSEYTKDDDYYLVLEDKLMRIQDYNRKRKQGKANRRRLRQPAANMPVTKREVELMGIKSEPISIRRSHKRGNRKGSAEFAASELIF